MKKNISLLLKYVVAIVAITLYFSAETQAQTKQSGATPSTSTYAESTSPVVSKSVSSAATAPSSESTTIATPKGNYPAGTSKIMGTGPGLVDDIEQLQSQLERVNAKIARNADNTKLLAERNRLEALIAAKQ